ncbi:hypothetical protein H8959_003608 [Pygathrix nigripes]
MSANSVMESVPARYWSSAERIDEVLGNGVVNVVLAAGAAVDDHGLNHAVRGGDDSSRYVWWSMRPLR